MLTIWTARKITGAMGIDMEFPWCPMCMCENTGHCTERRAAAASGLEGTGLNDDAIDICLPKRAAGYVLTYGLAMEEIVAIGSGIFVMLGMHGGNGLSWGEAALEGLKWAAMSYGVLAGTVVFIAAVIGLISCGIRRCELADIKAAAQAEEEGAGL